MAQSVYLSRQTPNYAEVSRETRHKANEILFQNLNFLKCDELFFRCDELFFLEGQRSITKK